MDDVLKLISEAGTQDNHGVWQATPSERSAFCQVRSVSRQEFYNAGRNGLNPAYVFIVAAIDYQGETVCEYWNEWYSIYRTYFIPGTDYIELYVERKGGTNKAATPEETQEIGNGSENNA